MGFIYNRCFWLAIGAALLGHPAWADPIPVGWPQPDGPGTAVTITYGYNRNLFEGRLLVLEESEIRRATEEALALWAAHAPLHFVERPDSGPVPSDTPYPATDHPLIRIGLHEMSEIAHAFGPNAPDGRAGDVHLDPTLPWSLTNTPWNFLEVMTHELGHAIGLPHDDSEAAIMNTYPIGPRFGELGTGFLLPADIRAVRAIYGAGSGSVAPIPEPATVALVATGLAVLVRRHRRTRNLGPNAGQPHRPANGAELPTG